MNAQKEKYFILFFKKHNFGGFIEYDYYFSEKSSQPYYK